MSEFWTCEKCGETYEKHANHEDSCEGSAGDRINALDERVAELEDEVEDLRAALDELRVEVRKK